MLVLFVYIVESRKAAQKLSFLRGEAVGGRAGDDEFAGEITTSGESTGRRATGAGRIKFESSSRAGSCRAARQQQGR